MTQDRSSVYRGDSREVAQAAYYADARAMVRMGYSPESEHWSTAVEQVLTVRYVYAPERAPAVLKALAEAEAEAKRAGPHGTSASSGSRRRIERAADLYDKQTPEVKITVGAITGLAAGVGLWSLLGVSILSGDLILLFVSLLGLGFGGLSMGAMVALRRDSRGR